MKEKLNLGHCWIYQTEESREVAIPFQGELEQCVLVQTWTNAVAMSGVRVCLLHWNECSKRDTWTDMVGKHRKTGQQEKWADQNTKWTQRAFIWPWIKWGQTTICDPHTHTCILCTIFFSFPVLNSKDPFPQSRYKHKNEFPGVNKQNFTFSICCHVE